MAEILVARADPEQWTLYLHFSDGLTGTICMRDLLEIGAFRLLRDPAVFAQALADPKRNVVSWRVGAGEAQLQLLAEVLHRDLEAHGAVRVDPSSDPAFQRFMVAATQPHQGEGKA